MATRGQVRVWHDEQGWGVLDSEATPGGCWAHFSSVLGTGYKRLRPDQDVTFTFEVAEQDAFSYRAIEVWPSGQEPERTGSQVPGPAYRSTVTLNSDDEAARGRETPHDDRSAGPSD